jgi:FKBP-type peptidyl-prolyl cis-trans isomerase
LFSNINLMKYVGLIGLLIATLVLASCGGESSSAESSGAGTVVTEISPERSEPNEPPHISVPSGPPPTKLAVKDLRVGRGAPVRPNTAISALYTSVEYGTGKPYETRWKPFEPFHAEFAPGLEIKGWEKGLIGMKVGGRRELIVPSRMAYGKGALVYVIDLVAVKCSGEQCVIREAEAAEGE